MDNLLNKKILLIICGGIAAYKSLEIIRNLKKRNVKIKTILTKSAKNFVTPLSITSLSKEKVYDDIFSTENEMEMDHISLSRWSDVILVAPTTANTIAKLSSGSSDDLASTVILASNKDIFLVPAMNVRMWEHPSTKENVIKLKKYGFNFIKFSLVEGCSHILTFIAGAKYISLSEANITVEAKSSDVPELNFAIVFAVVGETTIKSAHLDSDI